MRLVTSNLPHATYVSAVGYGLIITVDLVRNPDGDPRGWVYASHLPASEHIVTWAMSTPTDPFGDSVGLAALIQGF